MNRELNPKNYKRISMINWLLCVPLLILFAFPYIKIATFFDIEMVIAYSGSLLFAGPFMFTILHGHVTMALGTLHRHHYYRWLEEKPLTFGLLFHPIFTRTRFRLILLVCSAAVFIFGWILEL
jgi:hypothetical protein